jgi:hypothetical protein
VRWPGSLLNAAALGAGVTSYYLRGASIVWVAGELQPPPAGDPWTKAATADIDVTADGVTTPARVLLAPGERTILSSVTLPKPIAGGSEHKTLTAIRVAR